MENLHLHLYAMAFVVLKIGITFMNLIDCALMMGCLKIRFHFLYPRA